MILSYQPYRYSETIMQGHTIEIKCIVHINYYYMCINMYIFAA